MTVHSVLVADDHSLLVEVVSVYLTGQPDFAPPRCAGTLAATLAILEADGPFDILLLDLDMPGMQGMASVAEVIAANAGGRVVLFAGAATRDEVMQSVALGGAGYIPKSQTARSFLNALRFVAGGEVYLPSDMLMPGRGVNGRAQDGLLTDREAVVAQHLRRGVSNREIGEAMGLSEATVKMHIRTICRKLGVANRTQAAAVSLTRAEVA